MRAVSRAAIAVLAAAALASCASLGGREAGSSAEPPAALPAKGAILDVHDPSAALRCDGFYYLYSTGINIPARRSRDLVDWEQLAPALSGPPIWAVLDIPSSDSIWAPDLSYRDGRYYLYYAISTFGSNTSDIGLATNATLDPRNPSYDWKDEGKVLESREGDSWNAIDPNCVLDSEGRPWLAFGSFWGGIKLVRLDPATGKPEGEGARLYSIARRPDPPDAIEAPFISFRDGYYYLFASYDFCCRGADSTYNIRVGRSSEITGPYLDREGISLLDGGGTKVAECAGRWRGPGGESVFRAAHGRWWIAYHSYDRDLAGTPTLRLSPLLWDRDGWPRPVTPISGR
jgi:arabinan endo-1,5-alpha-L-arabinosidase